MKPSPAPASLLKASEHVRLEILRIVHTHAKDHQTVLEIARDYESYVLSADKAETPRQTEVERT
jgi:hypothetical protein